MPAVLFVCTGNTCRSPMAEALLKQRIKQAGLDTSQWRVESAGTWAEPGQPAAFGSVRAMERRELDLNHHRSKRVNADLLAEFDLILCMESGHKEAISAEFPLLAGKIFMLSQMNGRSVSISDPIGGYLTEYEETAQDIEGWIERGWETILEKTTENHLE